MHPFWVWVWLVLTSVYTCVNHYPSKEHSLIFRSSMCPFIASIYPPLLVPSNYWCDFCKYRLDLTSLEVHINVTILHIFFSVQFLWPRIMLWSWCIVVFLLLSSIPLCVCSTVCVHIHFWKLICGERQFIGKEVWGVLKCAIFWLSIWVMFSSKFIELFT